VEVAVRSPQQRLFVVDAVHGQVGPIYANETTLLVLGVKEHARSKLEEVHQRPQAGVAGEELPLKGFAV
jgi:hypothetical protein